MLLPLSLDDPPRLLLLPLWLDWSGRLEPLMPPELLLPDEPLMPLSRELEPDDDEPLCELSRELEPDDDALCPEPWRDDASRLLWLSDDELDDPLIPDCDDDRPSPCDELSRSRLELLEEPLLPVLPVLR